MHFIVIPSNSFFLQERREREQQEFESAKEMADEDYDCV